MIFRQGNLRLDPELGLSRVTMDVNVHPRLFAGKEMETKAALAKYGRRQSPLQKFRLLNYPAADKFLLPKASRAVFPTQNSPPGISAGAGCF
jgi:hypothetical protein